MKYIYFIIGIISYINYSYASLKDAMMPTNSNQIGVQDNGKDTINQVLIFVKDFIFNILWIIAVGVFLYFGFRLITSKGNPEEMKKTLIRFVYAIIGLAIIPLAYALVYLITTYKF